MNARSWRMGAAILFTTTSLACQHTAPARVHTGPPTAPLVEGKTVNGNISALDPDAGTVTIKLIFKHLVFAVAPTCEIITADSSHAKLTDLHVGDAVEAIYVPGGQPPVVHRLAVRGVTKEERDQAREKEHLDTILTPDPAERPAY